MGTLDGRTILVTGASKGIGKCIAELLGNQGANVIAQYGNDYAGVLEATESIPVERKLLIQADFEDPNAYKQLWIEALEWKGQIDVLIANAAVMPEAALTDSDEEWKNAWIKSFQVNSTSPAFLIREAVLHFLKVGGGNIIGISSWAAQRGSGNPKLGAYAASKAPIATLLKTVARAYGKNGIYCYIIAPGIVRTAMSESSARSTVGEAAITTSLAMKEWVPPSDVAELVAFLSTGNHRQLTGNTFDINGASYIR